MIDAVGTFEIKKNGGDAAKMESCRAALVAVSIKVPLAFKVLYFRDRSLDMVKHLHLDKLVVFMAMGGTGFWHCRRDLEDETVIDLIEESVGNALQELCNMCLREEKKNGKTELSVIDANCKDIGTLASKLVASDTLGVRDACKTDFRLLAGSLCDDMCPSLCERERAISELRSTDANGILLSLLRSPAIAHILDARVAGTQNSQSAQYWGGQNPV